MLEVTVHDVVVSLPAEVATLTQPQACKEHEGLAAVVLKERKGPRLLPVWVGRPEARDIMRHLGAMTAPRPMTFDFLVRVIEAGEM